MAPKFVKLSGKKSETPDAVMSERMYAHDAERQSKWKKITTDAKQAYKAQKG